jgi:hypothetical protein
MRTITSACVILAAALSWTCIGGSANLAAPGPGQSSPDDGSLAATNPGQISLRAIETIQRSQGVFVYTYAESLEAFDPYTAFESRRQLTEANVVRDIRALLSENREYQQQFTARCLPVWEYGVEFRESPERKTLFLFSFRCNTLMAYEEKAYRDFSPQAVRLYALLRYEVNARSSRPGH